MEAFKAKEIREVSHIVPIIRSTFYKKLSQYQKCIINEMVRGAVLDCNEGSNYICWLEYENGNKLKLNKKSCEIMLSNSVDDGWFKYTQTGIILNTQKYE